MKRILAAAFMILSSLIAPQLSAATRVEATLSLPHNHILPGVPFELVITFTNISKQVVAIDRAVATLVVAFPNGETSVLHQPEASDQWCFKPLSPVRLAPGQSVQQPVGWDHGYIPNWFMYESFSGPGTYGIALDLRILDDDEEVLGTIRTPAVELTRDEPVGIDAALWRRMQEVTGGKWSDDSFAAKIQGIALADEIIQSHPASGYYPYALALRALYRPNGNQISALLEAAGRFNDSPTYPYLLKAAADSARYEAWQAERRDKLEAVKYFKLAQSYYRDALATKSIFVRAEAEQGLRQMVQGLDRLAK